jgi:hypothetical protein
MNPLSRNISMAYKAMLGYGNKFNVSDIATAEVIRLKALYGEDLELCEYLNKTVSVLDLDKAENDISASWRKIKREKRNRQKPEPIDEDLLKPDNRKTSANCLNCKHWNHCKSFSFKRENCPYWVGK